MIIFKWIFHYHSLCFDSSDDKTIDKNHLSDQAITSISQNHPITQFFCRSKGLIYTFRYPSHHSLLIQLHHFHTTLSQLVKIVTIFFIIPLVLAHTIQQDYNQNECQSHSYVNQPLSNTLGSSFSDAGCHHFASSSSLSASPFTSSQINPSIFIDQPTIVPSSFSSLSNTPNSNPSSSPFSNQCISSDNINQNHFSNNIFLSPHSQKKYSSLRINNNNMNDDDLNSHNYCSTSGYQKGFTERDLNSESSTLNSLDTSQNINDWQVSDLVIVGLIDGSLHARNRQTGLELWSIPGERPLVQVSASNSCMTTDPSFNSKSTDAWDALSASDHPDCMTTVTASSANNEVDDKNIIWILEPLRDGILYYFTPQTGLVKIPVSIKDLVLQSPFRLHGDDKIFTGTSKTKLFSINSETGEMLRVYGRSERSKRSEGVDLKSTKYSTNDQEKKNLQLETENEVDKSKFDKTTSEYSDNYSNKDDINDATFDHFDNLKSQKSGSFLIGRTAYMLQIYGKNETTWNITFSTWEPPSASSSSAASSALFVNTVDPQKKLLAAHRAAQHYYQSSENIHVTPTYSNGILGLSADGHKKPVQWLGQVPDVAISVFDVFQHYYEEKGNVDAKESTAKSENGNGNGNKNTNELNSLNNNQDSMIVLSQPSLFFNHINNDPKLALSVFVQQTQGGQWYAVSGKNYPSFVIDAPDASWYGNNYYDDESINGNNDNNNEGKHDREKVATTLSRTEFFSSLIGVHSLNQQPQNKPPSSNSHNSMLEQSIEHDVGENPVVIYTPVSKQDKQLKKNGLYYEYKYPNSGDQHYQYKDQDQYENGYQQYFHKNELSQFPERYRNKQPSFDNSRSTPAARLSLPPNHHPRHPHSPPPQHILSSSSSSSSSSFSYSFPVSNPASKPSEFGLHRSVVRIFENVLAFGILFGLLFVVLAFSIRMGWVPQIFGLMDTVSNQHRQQQPSEKSKKEESDGEIVKEEHEFKQGNEKEKEAGSNGEGSSGNYNDLPIPLYSKKEGPLPLSNERTNQSATIQSTKDNKKPGQITTNLDCIPNTSVLLPSADVVSLKLKKDFTADKQEKSANNEKNENGEANCQVNGDNTSSAQAPPPRRRKRGTRGARSTRNKKKALQMMMDQEKEKEGREGKESEDSTQKVSGLTASFSTPNLQIIGRSPVAINSIRSFTNIHNLTNAHTPFVKVIDTAVTPISNHVQRSPLTIPPSPPSTVPPSPSTVLLSPPTLSPSLSSASHSLLTVSGQVLGYGSHGTVVLKGQYKSRDVAVKRMLLEFYDTASHEVSLLQQSKGHPNIVQYYCKKQSERFLYIGLELCDGTLEDWVEKKMKGKNEEQRDGNNNHDDDGDSDRFEDGLAELVKLVSPKQIMYQIGNGVKHLHSLNIVHRDLKPQNILVASSAKSLPCGKMEENSGGPPVRILISDFGLCKRLDEQNEKEAFFKRPTAEAAGTSGWRAPELLVDDETCNLHDTTQDKNEQTEKEGFELKKASATASINLKNSKATTMPDPGLESPYGSTTANVGISGNQRVTHAIDIFSLGCIFYYILTKGQHPFGDKILREANIVQNNFSLHLLEEKEEKGNATGMGTMSADEIIESRDLISRMIARNPSQRPNAQSILMHPFFWSSSRKLDFLVKVCDWLEKEVGNDCVCNEDNDSKTESRCLPNVLLKDFEKEGEALIGNNWSEKLGIVFTNSLSSDRCLKYKSSSSSILGLLKAIRDQSFVFDKMILEELKKEKMETYPERYLKIFTVRFPALLMTIYNFMVKKDLTREEVFKPFFMTDK